MRISFSALLLILSVASCDTPSAPHSSAEGGFRVDSLSLRITSELHPDLQEMRGRAYIYLMYHFENLPGRIERSVIAPTGVQPISVIRTIDRCSLGPIPVDTIAGGSTSWWFDSDISHVDTLSVHIELSGDYWDTVAIGDSCGIITYGPFAWSTRMMVPLEK